MDNAKCPYDLAKSADKKLLKQFIRMGSLCVLIVKGLTLDFQNLWGGAPWYGGNPFLVGVFIM